MRIKRDSIRGRVKSEVPIVFMQEKLTSYGVLEIFRRLLDRSGFTDRLRDAFSLRQFDGGYGSFRITLSLIGMLLVGGSRIRHTRHLEQDPVLLALPPPVEAPDGSQGVEHAEGNDRSGSRGVEHGLARARL